MNSHSACRMVAKFERFLSGLFVLGFLIGCCGLLHAHGTSPEPESKKRSVVRGKNLSVYLEESDYGFQTPGFSYDPQVRQIRLEEKSRSDTPTVVRTAAFGFETNEQDRLDAGTTVPRKTLRYSAAKSKHLLLKARPLTAKPQATKSFVPAKESRKKQPSKSYENYTFDAINQFKLIDSTPIRGGMSGNNRSFVPIVNPWEGVSPEHRTAHAVPEAARKAGREVGIVHADFASFHSPNAPGIPEIRTVSTFPSVSTSDTVSAPFENVSHSLSAAQEEFVAPDALPAPALPQPEGISLPVPTPTATPISEQQPIPEQRESLASPASFASAWKKGDFTFTPYGYVNLSAAWESQRTVAGDYCVYARSPQLNPESDRSAFHVDPRSSRIGLRIDAPGIPAWCGSKTTGVFEVDFQGAYQVRNRSGFLLRKAFVEVGDDCTKFLVGQDWEIVSPLFPMIFNYPAGSGAGNIGYRRAMMKIDHKFLRGADSTGLFQFGICDNTIRDYPGGGAEEPRVTTGGWPVLQGRLAWSFGKKNLAHRQDVTIGVSGQIGEQRADYPDGIRDATRGVSHKTWVVCLDLDLPITKRLRLQGEWYEGENVSNLEGGILQGIDLFRRDTIRCRGGWAAISLQWNRKMKTNFGYTVEDPLDRDAIATGSLGDGTCVARTRNRCLFGNVMYDWNKALMTGVELSFWKTDWRRFDLETGAFDSLESGKPVRVEFVTRYTF